MSVQGYHMKALSLSALLFLATLQLGCRENYSYPELNDVSGIAVMDWGNQIKKIDDPVLISKVVEFINHQRNGGWETPMTGFPDTKIKLYLYRNGNFAGSFGITESSFSMQRQGRWDAKPATMPQVQELLDLLSLDKALLK